MEAITVLNRKKQRLSALLHVPAKATDKIIIFTHSFKGDKNYQPIIGEFAKRICDEGFAMLRFDCFGSGESEGDFEESTVRTQIEDLEDVINYAKSQGYTRICLIGLSLGTSHSIMACDDSISCMVLWSPIFTHKGLYEEYKDEFLGKDFIIITRKLTGEEVKFGRAMLEDFRSVKPTCPVLAIIGSEDDAISEGKALEHMDLLSGEHTLEVISGGDHNFLVEEASHAAWLLVQHARDIIFKEQTSPSSIFSSTTKSSE